MAPGSPRRQAARGTPIEHFPRRRSSKRPGRRIIRVNQTGGRRLSAPMTLNGGRVAACRPMVMLIPKGRERIRSAP